MKIGRNEPCPCGSGKKYKKCCLGKTIPKIKQLAPNEVPQEAIQALQDKMNKARQEELQLQKIGIYINYVRPILFKGKKVWALGKNVYFDRPPNQTFHEFIIDNLRLTIGWDWWMEQLQLPFEKRHFIMQCFQKYSEWVAVETQKSINRVGSVWASLPNGWSRALVSLSFDVASLIHAQKLPEHLLNRLKSTNEFQGARYEIAMAAIFARLGFEIQFLDDVKRQDKHAEFIAIKDKLEIVVEAKSKHRKGVLHYPGEKAESDLKIKVLSLLHEAILKETDSKPFIIFIDVNYPITPGVKTEDEKWVEELLEGRKRDLDENTEDNPKYNAVFFTNFSFHYSGDDITPSGQFISELPQKHQFPLPDPTVINKLFDALNNYGNVPNIDTDLGI